MVLANAETINADFVGENRLLDDVADDLCMRQQLAVGPHCDVAKSIQSEFKNLCHDSCLRAWSRNVNAPDSLGGRRNDDEGELIAKFDGRSASPGSPRAPSVC
jgi:hypothetical protein